MTSHEYSTLSQATFPLIPLPKKCCDFRCQQPLYRACTFPLIPLPKKCCDDNARWLNAKGLVSINSTSEEVL